MGCWSGCQTKSWEPRWRRYTCWLRSKSRARCCYKIGLLSNQSLNCLNWFSVIVDRVGADITVLREQQVDYDFDVSRKIAEVLIRKVPDDQQVSESLINMCPFQGCLLFFICVLFSLQFLDLRVAVLGNVDSGKSTLLGVLTQGELDNGRGRARLNLFRHLHEIQTGRTSSISFEILGFNTKGEVRKYRRNRAELRQVQKQ